MPKIQGFEAVQEDFTGHLGPTVLIRKENGFVPAIWGVKQPRDHLPIYKLDLPDPIFMVPELKKGHFRAKKPKN